MVNPDNAELYKVTSLSVNIEDDEPKEKSVVSFSRNSYTSKDGNATVTIKRKNAEYSLCDFTLLSSSITAVAGENYEEQIKTVTFIPYETEKTIEIPVSGEGEFKLLMSDMTGCESGKYAETVVKIKNNADDESDISLMGNENQTNDITIRVKYTQQVTELTIMTFLPKSVHTTLQQKQTATVCFIMTDIGVISHGVAVIGTTNMK